LKDFMSPSDANLPGQGHSDRTGGDDLFLQEQELLAKVRDTARKIVDRVNRALGGTDTHAPLPADEKPLQ
jgi:hypothetical protein